MATPSEESGYKDALLSFTAENTRSYRDEVHLSLLGTRLSSKKVARSLIPAGMTKPVRVLPAAGIFGANASGKTMILRAMDDMRELVTTSFHKGTRITPIVRRPFLLDPDGRVRPTRFEVDLLLGGVRWIYGFEVDDERVREEWAYHWPRGRQARVFEREGRQVVFGSPFRVRHRTIENLLRDNSLLLSIADATNNEPLAPLTDWFATNLVLADSGSRDHRAVYTAEVAKEQGTRVTQMLKAADLEISSIETRRLDDKESELALRHTSDHGDVLLRAADESQGTMAWISLIGPILDTLDHGNVLLVDDLDAGLHPHLVERIISMFQNPQTNKRSAQLIFNSHDGTILDGSSTWSLGRDQIWFTEKYIDGDTRLYPLHDFSPRRDEDIAGRYFQGRYGAVPVLSDTRIRQALASIDE